MTANPTPLPPEGATQADRELLVKIYGYFARGYHELESTFLREQSRAADKLLDNGPLMTLIRSHRIAATSAAEGEVERLKARLEINPEWDSEDADGIACRNDTIAILDKNIATLKANLTKAEAANARLKEAIGRIASKNDLSGVPDSDIESAARHALYECELIARDALDQGAEG